MSARDIERWRAHFRYRKEIGVKEWLPVTERMPTKDELWERLDRIGR